VQKNHRLQLFAKSTIKKQGSRFSLQGGKADDTTPVTIDHPRHEVFTKPAHTIKKNNRGVARRRCRHLLTGLFVKLSISHNAPLFCEWSRDFQTSRI
jgi:hypothetical protein